MFLFKRPVSSGVTLVYGDAAALSLVYIDLQATKHTMCWREDTWLTTCGIQLGPRTGIRFTYADGYRPIDIRDIAMAVPTCIECIAAEEGKPVPR